MMFQILRTNVADNQIRKIIMYVSEIHDSDAALKALDDIETNIKLLEDNPNLGIIPKDRTLKRQGYRLLITKKNIIFYKVNEKINTITIYAVVDQKQDYIKIINGL